MTVMEQLIAGMPPEAESPVWRSNSFYWEYFVPDVLRENWDRLDKSTKAAVYATALHANEHLKASGCFDY